MNAFRSKLIKPHTHTQMYPLHTPPFLLLCEVQNDRILAGELPTEASTVGTVGCEAGFDGRSQQLMMTLPVREIVNETNEMNDMNTVMRNPKRLLGE